MKGYPIVLPPQFVLRNSKDKLKREVTARLTLGLQNLLLLSFFDLRPQGVEAFIQLSKVFEGSCRSVPAEN